MKNVVYTYVVRVIMLSLCLIGCTPSLTPEASPPPAITGSSTPTPSPDTGLDSEFPLTCPTSAGAPDAQFVADLTLPEEPAVQPGTTFRQTWRLKNTGDCAWPEQTQLILISGNIDTAPNYVPVLSAAPGTEVDITVELTTPSQPGEYQSYWRLQAPQEQLFGDLITMVFTVLGDDDPSQPVATAAPPPTPHPTRVPKPTLTPPPVATRFPSITSPGSCQGPASRFTTLINQATEVGIPVTCAIGPVEEARGTIQIFWQEIESTDRTFTHRSLIIWQASNDGANIAYVLRGRDEQTFRAQVRVYQDTWTPEMPEQPEACSPLVPPEGYLMPTQGIGKVWCEKSLWNSIGWPKSDAQPATITMQRTSTGLLMAVDSQDGKTYYVAIHLDAKAATVYAAP